MPALEGVWGNGCTDSRILDLGTSSRSVVSLTTLPPGNEELIA
jgi:hypothetical protein